MAYLIGVDIGTMGTKTALYDESGHLVADAFEPALYENPPSTATQ